MKGGSGIGDFREYPIPKDALASETPAALENQACIVTLPLELGDLFCLLRGDSRHLCVLCARLYLVELSQEVHDALGREDGGIAHEAHEEALLAAISFTTLLKRCFFNY